MQADEPGTVRLEIHVRRMDGLDGPDGRLIARCTWRLWDSTTHVMGRKFFITHAQGDEAELAQAVEDAITWFVSYPQQQMPFGI